jgi:hypothetical protein
LHLLVYLLEFLLYFTGMTYIPYVTYHKRMQNDIFHEKS